MLIETALTRVPFREAKEGGHTERVTPFVVMETDQY